MIALASYVACIVAANVAIAVFGFVPVGFGLVAPAGVYCAGASFSARDWAQHRLGRSWTFGAIVVGAAISAALSPSLALASGVAFAVSETLDMLVYTPLAERQPYAAVALSGAAGLVADSALFLLLAFGSLDYLAGQIVGKAEMIAPALVLLYVYRSRREARLWRFVR